MSRSIFALFAVILLGSCYKRAEMNEEDVKKGETLFAKMGCFTCHSLEGKAMYGPSLNNIAGREVEVIRKGKVIKTKIDRQYLKKSILNPGYETVKSFEGRKMPVPAISNEEAEYIIDYILKVNHSASEQE